MIENFHHQIDPESSRYVLLQTVISDKGNKRVAVIFQHSDEEEAFQIWLKHPGEEADLLIQQLPLDSYVLNLESAKELHDLLGKEIEKIQLLDDR